VTPLHRTDAAIGTAVAGVAIAAVSVGAAIALPAAPFTLLLALAFGAVCVWMFTSARYAWSLVALLLYLALVDGALRLASGHSELTLLRDGLLYAIVLGVVVRGLVRGQALEPPPLTGWVVAFVAVVLVQLANPADGSFAHSLAALRPHLEWVPLFFFGYALLRTAPRLRIFFVLLLVVAAINGAVNFVQLNLSVSQFAAWGPGYYQRLHGTDGLSGRSYAGGTDPNTGKQISRNRSFGLGSDIGFGGAVGMLALPGGLALTVLARRRTRQALLYAALTGGAVFAVLTSAQRTSVVSAVVAACAFALIVSSARRARQLLFGLATVGLVTGAIVFFLANGPGGAFYRYSGIAPTRVVPTAIDSKGGTLALVPQYVADFPLGAGIGSVGPAVSLGGQAHPGRVLNGDSEATYLLVELGVAGLLVLLAFSLRLIIGSWRRVRRVADDEQRLLLAALVAALVALVTSGLAGAATSNTPGGPFFWFAAGTLSFWLFRTRMQPAAGSVATKLRPAAPPLALPPRARSTTRIRIVCGPVHAEVDAIRDYADHLASALADRGLEVEVDREPPEAHPADVILLNYNPFSYGRRGFARAPAAGLRRARRRGSRICLVVHESYVPALNWRWAVLGAWQRVQLRRVVRCADVVFTPVEPLARKLAAEHLPVGSNLPDLRRCRGDERARLALPRDALVIAAFGTGHPSRRIEDVAGAANAAADVHQQVVVLNLGAGAPPVRGLRESVRLIEPGWLEASDVARHLAAADLFVAPFVDGVSTRRTTLMAALQHGLPVVGTDGRLTDGVLRSSHALTLVPVDDRQGLSDAARALAGDPGRRHALGAAGRELYERAFDWPVIAATIVAALR
jgi:glycosyltransferase involved in cell wall biosynthesis